MSMLSKKFTKVKKRLSNSSPLATGSVKQCSDALANTETSFEGIFLWDVSITDDDVIYLSDDLSQNQTLKRLDLFNCGITDKGVQYISEMVAKIQTLTMLALSSNLGITSVSTSAIFELIQATTSLEILNLCNTSLNNDDIKTIRTAVKKQYNKAPQIKRTT